MIVFASATPLHKESTYAKPAPDYRQKNKPEWVFENPALLSPKAQSTLLSSAGNPPAARLPPAANAARRRESGHPRRRKTLVSGRT
jgi:hypothetical protein